MNYKIEKIKISEPFPEVFCIITFEGYEDQDILLKIDNRNLIADDLNNPVKHNEHLNESHVKRWVDEVVLLNEKEILLNLEKKDKGFDINFKISKGKRNPEFN